MLIKLSETRYSFILSTKSNELSSVWIKVNRFAALSVDIPAWPPNSLKLNPSPLEGSHNLRVSFNLARAWRRCSSYTVPTTECRLRSLLHQELSELKLRIKQGKPSHDPDESEASFDEWWGWKLLINDCHANGKGLTKQLPPALPSLGCCGRKIFNEEFFHEWIPNAGDLRYHERPPVTEHLLTSEFVCTILNTYIFPFM